MINRILVPLDGSKLAECVLSYAEEMGQKLGAEIVLVSVTHRAQGFWPMEDSTSPTGARMVPEAVCTIEEQAGNYLNGIASRLNGKGIKTSTEVICGKVPDEIAIYANSRNIDLAVMSDHGHNGLSKLTHGRVLQDVLKKSQIPVMVVRSKECKSS